jgi:hypothetical protein
MEETAAQGRTVMDILDDIDESSAESTSSDPLTYESNHVREQIQLSLRLAHSMENVIGQSACKICAMDMCNGVLSCGHEFCKQCVDEWFRSREQGSVELTCPVCMRDFGDHRSPLFVPLLTSTLPPPPFCADDDERRLWQDWVCRPKMSAAAFWLVTMLRRAEARGQCCVVLVSNVSDMKVIHRACARWKDTLAIMPVSMYNGACLTRQKVEIRFAQRKSHIIVAYDDVVSGFQLQDVSDVLSFRSVTHLEQMVLAARFGRKVGEDVEDIVIHSCVYGEV